MTQKRFPEFSSNRVLAISRKEVLHIVRDWQTLMIVLALPVVMMFLYGYALTMDVKELPVIIESPDNTPAIRDIAGRVDAGAFFNVIGTTAHTEDIHAFFRKHRIKAVIRFPAGFEQDLRNGGNPAPIEVLIDGSDQNIGTLIRNSAEPLLRKIILDYLAIEQPEPIKIQPRILYNPEQKSALFFVPGLMAIILMMISAMLTSLTITREKENRTLQQLLISPLRPREIILGKILPYVFLAAMDGILLLLVGRINFGIIIMGSLLFLALSCFIYIFTALSLGLIISTVAKNQQQAMLMVLPATILPIIILSGFIFPIASMPVPLQWISHIIPATYFLEIIRGIILKGVGFTELYQPLVLLTMMGLALFGVAVKKFGAQK